MHSEDTTASHGHCRRLEQKTRLPHTATAGGLEQQDTTASHGNCRSATTQRPRMSTAGRLVAGLLQRSCRRSYSEDEMASHGPCRSTLPLTALGWRSYRRRGLTRPLAGGLVAGLSQRSCRRSYSEDEMASHGPCRSTCLSQRSCWRSYSEDEMASHGPCRSTCGPALRLRIPGNRPNRRRQRAPGR